MEAAQEQRSSWLDRPILTTVTLNWELVLFSLIILLFVVTRFYDLGARVMSHDESLHTYYSWLLYKGRGFQHTPLMHGPLQFHLIALSYFLFGDNDLTARIPAVLASIFSVLFLWNYRAWLGRAGTLIAAGLFLISPFLLYYGRYVRNEALVVPLGLVTIWAILRYLENGQHRYLYYLTAATVLHFTSKETAFIYTAQALLFLGFFFIHRITRNPWPKPAYRRNFLIVLVITLAFVGAAAGYMLVTRNALSPEAGITAAPSVPGEDVDLNIPTIPPAPTIALIVFAGLAFLSALFLLVRGYSWKQIRAERSFDLIILLGTLTLPLLAPFPVAFFGWDPLDYSGTGMFRTALFLVPMVLISLAIGLWWKPRVWLINAAIFYAVFVVFYTTIFTNGGGFFTGMVGSLGYWLEQQGVRRGSQPIYYYLLVQIPVYAYLPALGSLLAGVVGAIRWWGGRGQSEELAPQSNAEGASDPIQESGFQPAPAIALIGFWAVTSLIAYTVAGEKMPWLTVHIVWPMILLTGWALGYLLETTNWKALQEKKVFLIIALMVVFFASTSAVFGSLLGTNPPFAGRELEQLQATSTFLTALITAIASGAGLIYLLRTWDWGQVARVATLTLFSLLAILTARAAFIATYINYDNATEYLVYAHGARGVKDVMDQLEDISRRTTDGLALQVGYDDDVSWPFTWYLRNYTNQRYYAKNPTRDLREVPVILAGDDNFGAVEPIVGQAFYEFEYIRMVWPDQDYFNLTLDRIWYAITNPEMRSAILQIWLNRDYGPYTALKNKDLSLPNWSPSDRMRMYVRKDVATTLWNYGVGPAPEQVVADPYEGGQVDLQADEVFGGEGPDPGLFQAPRGIAFAPDGSLYIADSGNHRIQHLAPDGSLLQSWGTFSGGEGLNAPEGTFNEPWGIDVGSDGSVYVADTWNHRIQKFSPEGEFLGSWGYFGQAEDSYAIWGPRDVAVDSAGRVLVTDTGNKRVIVYNENGEYIDEIGGPGFGLGEFNEPTGLAVNNEGLVFVADTWNQRVQTMVLDQEGNISPLGSWDMAAWYGQSLENKPYLTVDEQNQVFISDPEGFRIIQFTAEGEFIRYWGDFSTGVDGLNLPTGIAADGQGGIWVTDAGNHWVLRFTPPQ